MGGRKIRMEVLGAVSAGVMVAATIGNAQPGAADAIAALSVIGGATRRS